MSALPTLWPLLKVCLQTDDQCVSDVCLRIQSSPLRQHTELRMGNRSVLLAMSSGTWMVPFDLAGSLLSHRLLCSPSRAASLLRRRSAPHPCSSSLSRLLIHRLQQSVTHTCKISFMGGIKHSSPESAQFLWATSLYGLTLALSVGLCSDRKGLICILYIITAIFKLLSAHQSFSPRTQICWDDVFSSAILFVPACYVICMPVSQWAKKRKRWKDAICAGRLASERNRLWYW